MEYLYWKWAHILSATILFGTGIGIAFFKLWGDRQGDARTQYAIMRAVVLADWIFTTPAIIAQLLSGVWLARLAGYPLYRGWVLWALCLFLIAGACWLPVVWLQIRMREQLRAALEAGTAAPPEYAVCRKTWIALGILAFSALVAVFYLMIFKPDW